MSVRGNLYFKMRMLLKTLLCIIVHLALLLLGGGGVATEPLFMLIMDECSYKRFLKAVVSHAIYHIINLLVIFLATEAHLLDMRSISVKILGKIVC